MIETKNLGYWYGRVLALNDVACVIPAGITGLVGPNGSGKTTFLRLAVGMLRPISGSVTINGETPWGHTNLSRRVGYAPQNEIGFQHSRGREWIRFVLRLKGFRGPEATRRADDILERTHAAPFADKKIAAMSRGMRQRIKLCAALAHDPETLILDEPLTGSDPIARAEILRLIRQFAVDTRTVVMSTHVLQEVEELTDQVVVLHRGRLIAQGRVREIRALIDRHPHEIRVGTPRVRDLAAVLAREPDVRSLQVEDSTLVLRTSSPSTFYPKLTRIIADGDFAVEHLTSPDDNLEAVFRYLTER